MFLLSYVQSVVEFCTEYSTVQTRANKSLFFCCCCCCCCSKEKKNERRLSTLCVCVIHTFCTIKGLFISLTCEYYDECFTYHIVEMMNVNKCHCTQCFTVNCCLQTDASQPTCNKRHRDKLFLVVQIIMFIWKELHILFGIQECTIFNNVFWTWCAL